MKGLYEKEEKLVLEYIDKQYKNKQSEQDMDRNFISMEQKTGHKKDSILARLYDVPDPLLWQIAKVRNLGFSLQNIKTRSIAREYVDSIKQKLTHHNWQKRPNICSPKRIRRKNQFLSTSGRQSYRRFPQHY